MADAFQASDWCEKENKIKNVIVVAAVFRRINKVNVV
jgi:hypothetical protein